LITAYGRDEIIQKAERIGVDAVLVKPVNRSVLFNTIMELFVDRASFLPAGRERELPSRVPEDCACRRGRPGPGRQTLAGARVLLVEDHPINQLVAVELLRTVGLEVEVTNNGKEALQRLKQDDTADSSFNVVLMDLLMPEMDGHEATQRIRRDPQLCHLPIVALTADAMSGEKEKCLESGMDDYVAKPVDEAQLMAVLQRWIKPTGSGGQSCVEKSDSPAWAILPQELPGFDMPAALGRLNANEELFLTLAQRFCDDYQGCVERLSGNKAEQSWELMQSTLHAIKGIAGNLGATELYSTTAALERQLRAAAADPADLPSLEEQWESFVAAFEVVCRSIASLPTPRDVEADSPAKEGSPADYAGFFDGLAALRRSLEEGDTEVVEQFAALRRLVPAPGLQEPLARLEKRIDDFDFDDALVILDEVVQTLNTHGEDG
jgi:CheY-like chemotaxis protein/HPt (histidine-containing phosphotransfer) domain-containing protein